MTVPLERDTPGMYSVWIAGLPPKLANRRSGNWRSYHFPRAAWMKSAANALRSQLGRVEPCEQLSVKVIAYVPRAMDQDNADGFRKCAHDLLQHVGWIPNDSPAHLIAHPVEMTVVGSAPRRPKNPADWPKYGQRMMQHLNKLGLMLEIEVRA